MLIPFLPLALLVIVIIWGALLQKAASDFKRPPKPLWPFPHNPGLALQLADSDERVNDVLGPAGTDLGDANRKVAKRLQKLDFPFIVLYVLFFSSVPFARSGLSRGWIAVVALALLTALFDVTENVQILRMIGEKKRGSAKLFGQTKWFCYFATLGVQGGLLLFEDGRSSGRELLAIGIGIALILIAIGGVIPSVMGRFGGIKSATKLSALGLLALACTPLIGWYPYSFSLTAEYVAHLRVPLLLGCYS